MTLKLKRSLKFTRLVAITMGTPLASSVFLSIIIMELITQNLETLILAVIISTVLATFGSFAYGELVSIYPSAAGNRIFLKRPLGDLPAVSLSFMWTLIILGAGGVEAYVLGNVLNFIFPVLPALLWAFLSLTAILIINIMGVELSGNFQMFVTFSVASALIMISIVTWLTPHPSVNIGGGINFINALAAAAVGVYFFLGFGRVTTLGEEAIDYKRGIPLAMPVAIIALGSVFIFISSAIFIRVPLSLVATSPIPQILLGEYLLNRNTAIIVAVVSAIMSFSTFNAGILGTSRLIYALGREGTLPSFLGRINSRFFTPTYSLILLYVIVLIVTVLVFLTRSFTVPVLVAALFDSFIYALVSYSAFWHHRKLDKKDIPFMVKGGKIIFPATSAIFIILGILLVITSAPLVSILVLAGCVISGIYFFFKIR